MPRQIFRFEIQHEVARSGNNVIHEARDMMDGSTVQLFEWNPREADNKTAGEIEAARNELDGAELFTDRSCYYLAAKSEDAKSTLDALRARKLFEGDWPGFFAEPPPLPPPGLPKRPAEPPVKKGSSKLWIFGTAVFAIATGVLALILQSSTQENQATNSRIETLNDKISELQSGNENVRKDLDKAKSDLEAQKQSFEALEESAGKALVSMFEDAERSVQGVTYNTLVVHNCTSNDLRLAVRYKSLLGTSVTRGWIPLKGRGVLYFKSLEPFMYEYHDGWTGKSPETGNFGIVKSQDFVIQEGRPWIGKTPETVAMFKGHGVDIGCP